jgi:hypothetical protein
MHKEQTTRTSVKVIISFPHPCPPPLPNLTFLDAPDIPYIGHAFLGCNGIFGTVAGKGHAERWGKRQKQQVAEREREPTDQRLI